MYHDFSRPISIVYISFEGIRFGSYAKRGGLEMHEERLSLQLYLP